MNPSLILTCLASVSPRLFALFPLLAQVSDDSVVTQPAPSPLAGAIGGLFGLLLAVVAIVSMWKIFTKAGRPGWESIIPIYNIYILLKIAGKPGWWLILLFIPLVNLIILIVMFIALAQSFGKGVGFGLGLAFLGIIFLPILAFGDAQYRGAGAAAAPVLT